MGIFDRNKYEAELAELRNEIGELKRAISSLTDRCNEAGVYPITFGEQLWTSRLWPVAGTFHKVSLYRAITLIANHLGVEFKETPAAVATVELVKVPAKKARP